MRSGRAVVVLLVLVALLGGTSTAMAQPPSPAPPPNPSDGELQRSRDAVSQQAVAVGRLTTQLADLDSRAEELNMQLAGRREIANRALVDMQNAQDAAVAATRKAEAARVETNAASAAIDAAHRQFDDFIAVQYQQALGDGPLGLLNAATSPDDLLDRAQLTNVIAQQQKQALDGLERARVDKANADSRARAAQEEARARADQAQRAKTAADDAMAQAESAAQAQAAQLAAVQAQRAGVQNQLDAAQAADAGLRGQRARFQEWQREQQAAEAARERAEQQAAASRVASAAGSPRAAAGSSSVQRVIDRAMSQLGVQYAWGGGTGSGPSLGIRDGGVADEFGDYRKIGFDCSGLMIYAFAGAGISLPHYSGYQYTSGQQVPVAQRRPGDMLFYSDGGTIVHVTLYIGNGQMIEAPYSGSHVRVTAVRTNGLMPYATRML
ncbi:NlpC/P60 family protein [Pseudonocardia acidicola]|uniref:NlpC/P60 family protein n=1 Tax=Pseudonocardia acidicola TaxID=2724939 RepID=UPI00308414C3